MSKQEEVYKQLLDCITEIDEYYFDYGKQMELNMRNELHVLTTMLSALLPTMEQCIELKGYMDSLTNVFIRICNAMEEKDDILVADLITDQLKPVIIIMIEALRETGIETEFNDELVLDVPDCYVLQVAQTGRFTIQVQENKNKYLASTVDPYIEGLEIAEQIFGAAKYENQWGMKTICIFGLGAGYHIQALTRYPRVYEIFVYETDEHIISICRAIMPQLFCLKNVHIIHDPVLSLFSEEMQKADTNIYLHIPSVECEKNNALKEALKDFHMWESSVRGQVDQMLCNFYYNMQLKDRSIDYIKHQFTDKIMVLVAGGPSLDEELELLKETFNTPVGGCVIVCVGTVFYKLIRYGIIPDYVIMTDSQPAMEKQLEGIRKKDMDNTALLYLATVSFKITQTWSGDRRFVIFQKGLKQTEEYAREQGYMTLQTGGSVSTTAIDLGITMGCRTIIALGLDLAFYNNCTHASGTPRREELKDNRDSIYVEDIHGNQIATSRNLNLYRKWIEKRIKQISNEKSKITLINCSKGARINGMEILPFSAATQIIKNSKDIGGNTIGK